MCVDIRFWYNVMIGEECMYNIIIVAMTLLIMHTAHIHTYIHTYTHTHIQDGDSPNDEGGPNTMGECGEGNGCCMTERCLVGVDWHIYTYIN